MHDLEPYYNWRDDYIAADDERSPFYGTVYSEFEFDKKVYNYLLHPQWDEFGSTTLYLKILYVDYDKGFSIIELIGEWNDAIYNDIMVLKREIIDVLIGEGIQKFLLIGENVLNFHGSDDSYYEEWYEDIEDGWIVALNFRDHVIQEFKTIGVDYYIHFGGELDTFPWRTLKPKQLYHHIQERINKRLGG
ncbi:hypothetical protein [Sphingobacterium psychroaquaticum]|uniref:Uncharacterized protein n=1 Tax=Sphingobacterium psychroaquaticum TaxID=561061 RepID=A0A1X7KHV4_9SPHI|nr:hypothetical protein [Sphingobacterium psychroaquaticum]QBQ42814.1 hypothetical protein E2P86_17365 [Sphingobacterium psychroaquaticum]SMG40201.1 hypothetical protein SAMN05660862_2868 [Sphingobacterium psychroaquaticum]